MPLILGTDTFITDAEADAYLGFRLRAAEWGAATDAQKEAALRMATDMLSRERYIGRVASFSQPLAWPRIGNTTFSPANLSPWQADARAPVIGGGVVDQEGRLIPSDTIPKAIAHATAELALFLLRYDITDDRMRRAVFSIRSEQVGDSMQTYDSAGSNENSLPAIVRDMIAPFLASGAGCSARLIP